MGRYLVVILASLHWAACVSLNNGVTEEATASTESSTQNSDQNENTDNTDPTSETPSAPACTPTFGAAKLLFTSYTNITPYNWDAAQTNSGNLWIVDPDGTNLTAVTENHTQTFVSSAYPFVSYNADKVVFQSGQNLTAGPGNWNGGGMGSYNIWEMNADTLAFTDLTQTDNGSGAPFNTNSEYPETSKDGTKIVFESFTEVSGGGPWPFNGGTKEDSSNIWIMDYDSSNRAPLTTIQAANMSSQFPSFSPDGSKILFRSKMDPADPTDTGTATSSYNVWTMDVDGSSKTALTQNTNANLDVHLLTWSPDGTKIYFESDQNTSTNSSTWNLAQHPRNIWVMNSDGSNITPLTANTNTTHWTHSKSMSLSRDGTMIAFSSRMSVTPHHPTTPGPGTPTDTDNFNLWTMKSDGTEQKALTFNYVQTFDLVDVRWRPDGEMISFSSVMALNGNWDDPATSSNNVWVINKDGTGRTAITQNNNANLNSGFVGRRPWIQKQLTFCP